VATRATGVRIRRARKDGEDTPEGTWARVAAWAGLVGVAAITGSSVVAALAYSGTSGEPFSPLNHWVSELGEVGVSELAWVFNVGLMVGGTCFVVFMLGLAATRTGWLRFGYGLIGAVTGVAGSLVGVFPMNVIGAHQLAAFAFFNLGWIAVGIASVDFVRRPEARFPRWLAVLGVLTVAAFIAFMQSLRTDPSFGEDVLAAPIDRPGIWMVTALEWAVIIGILAWTLAASVTWLRAGRSGSPG
jgi:hypothetical membrane protein